jgi:Fe/S biogenesis protein NfuA
MDPTMSNIDEAPVLQVNRAAAARVLELRASESDADGLALWVEVSGTAGDAYTYDMYFQAAADTEPGDSLTVQEGLPVVVPADSVTELRGAVLDLDAEGGMVIRNPNQPVGRASPAMGRPPADLSGDVAQRVVQVLDGQINPAIAAHGGHAELVAVEDDTAYLRLSGGCAGCGLAAVTLSQGIEVAIFDAVPEIHHVVDVTDHAAGTNPYFEPAKK